MEAHMMTLDQGIDFFAEWRAKIEKLERKRMRRKGTVPNLRWLSYFAKLPLCHPPPVTARPVAVLTVRLVGTTTVSMERASI